MAFFFLLIPLVGVMIFQQKRRRFQQVKRGYLERIEKLEKRLNEVEGEAKIATENQLRFLHHAHKEYVSEKRGFF